MRSRSHECPPAGRRGTGAFARRRHARPCAVDFEAATTSGRGPRGRRLTCRDAGRGARLPRRDGARGPYRSLTACGRGALHRRPFAGRARPGVSGLGNASRQCTGQADAARRQGGAQGCPLRQLRRPLRHARRRRRVLHRAIAAGPALFRRRLAPLALQLHPPGVSAQSAMVAQCDHRDSRDFQAARRHDRVHVAAIPRHGLAVEFPADQSRGAPDHGRKGRHEPGERPAKFRRGLGARHQRQEAGRRGELPSRPRRRRDPRQGHLSQPPHRADPVRACDRRSPAGANSHCSRLDHEILHPRPLAAELPGEISHRAGFHGVHDLLEEPGTGGPRPRLGRLPDARRDGRARSGERRAPESEGACGRVLSRRDADGDCRGGDDARRRRAAPVP